MILRGDERLDVYQRDESPLGPFPCDAAALCHSTEEVAAGLRLCAEHQVPVTPRGAGSGLTGGCLPVRGGVVLSVEKMQRIKEISPDDMVAVVEPGVTQRQLSQHLAQAGVPYWMDCTGAGPHSSLIGNIVERRYKPLALRIRSWRGKRGALN